MPEMKKSESGQTVSLFLCADRNSGITGSWSARHGHSTHHDKRVSKRIGANRFSSVAAIF